MTILILERVPTALRGYLTGWLLEPRAGVFVGNVSALVRDELWKLVCKHANGGACLMIHPARNEQGFAVRVWGSPKRVPVDMEGITLIKVFKNSDTKE
ncbi:MAG: type I-E CRISPR-associated endoribonuclease Cas2e [Candidatus Sumerlaea chitinivorans]|jgi:CRISPR-associated protein Cas2|nr:type I-E CRISPR-associated endoribonuclease Cas2e [Candidatus Sumerlaea chitinivorans]